MYYVLYIIHYTDSFTSVLMCHTWLSDVKIQWVSKTTLPLELACPTSNQLFWELIKFLSNFIFYQNWIEFGIHPWCTLPPYLSLLYHYSNPPAPQEPLLLVFNFLKCNKKFKIKNWIKLKTKLTWCASKGDQDSSERHSYYQLLVVDSKSTTSSWSKSVFRHRMTIIHGNTKGGGFLCNGEDIPYKGSHLEREQLKRFLVKRGFSSGATNLTLPACTCWKISITLSLKVYHILFSFEDITEDLVVGETNLEFCPLYSMLFDIGKFSTFHLIHLIGHKGISGICRILQILDFICAQIGIKSIFYTFGLIGLIGSV